MNYVFPVFVAVIVGMIVLFSVIYYVLPDNSYYVLKDGKERNLSYGESLMYSVGTQTLLGLGDISPTKNAAMTFTSIQSFSTLVILVLITTTKLYIGKPR